MEMEDDWTTGRSDLGGVVLFALPSSGDRSRLGVDIKRLVSCWIGSLMGPIYCGISPTLEHFFPFASDDESNVE
jgi:hypothetical protein